MKKISVLIAAIFAFSAPIASYAADHSGHGAHDTGHGGNQGDVAHQQVVDGVKATFKIMSMKDHMKAMGMELPKGMKETHHIAVEFKDAKTGKALTEGEVKVKVQNPDKTDQTKDLMAMQGHFGADFNFSKKGEYGVMSRYLVKDGKIRQSKFWYAVK